MRNVVFCQNQNIKNINMSTTNFVIKNVYEALQTLRKEACSGDVK
jgi:hypothetical protein